MNDPDLAPPPPLSRRLHWWALAIILLALIVATIVEGRLDSATGRRLPTRVGTPLRGLARPSVKRFLRRLKRTSSPRSPPVTSSPRHAQPPPTTAKPPPARHRVRSPKAFPGVRAQARAAPILAFDVGTPNDTHGALFMSENRLRAHDENGVVGAPSLPLPQPVGLWPLNTDEPVDRLTTTHGADRSLRGRRVQLHPAPRGHVLLPGTVIPAVLLTRLVSDLSGLVEARTSRAVYGSIHERTLLIPAGSLLVGRYGESVRPGERRIFVSFDRIETPNGASIRLPGMEAAGQRGGAGLHDLVRTHFWRMFGSSFLIAGLGAALPDNTSQELVLPSGTPLIAGTAAGEALDQTVQDLLARDQDLPPTIIIRRGTRFNVLVARTIRFPSPERGPTL